MTTMNSYPTSRRAVTPKKVLLFCAGIAAGAATGTGLMTLVKFLGVNRKALSGFDLLSCTIAALFLAAGLVQGGIAMNRRQLGKMLEGNVDGAGDEIGERLPATDAEVRTALLQAAVLFLAGFLLLVPIAAQGHPAAAPWVFAGIFLLFLVQTAMNLQVWRSCDEVIRGAILATCAVTFSITQGLLFLWAAAERLHLVAICSSWDIYSLLMACYIVVNTGIARRYRR